MFFCLFFLRKVYIQLKITENDKIEKNVAKVKLI